MAEPTSRKSLGEFSLAELANAGEPTRDDDTVVIAGGRRASLDEVLALIAADEAARHPDG